MYPKCQVQIVLNDMPASKARALLEALEPDNTNFPDGLGLEASVGDDGRLVLDFSSNGEIGRMIGTIDEILEHIQVALKVMERQC